MQDIPCVQCSLAGCTSCSRLACLQPNTVYQLLQLISHVSEKRENRRAGDLPARSSIFGAGVRGTCLTAEPVAQRC